jgi:LPXTG-site transpeptidase (sortase) family protein
MDSEDTQLQPNGHNADDSAAASAQSMSEQAEARHAANLIRGKLQALYEAEPDAKTEIAETRPITKDRSKHQQFMYELSKSGKSMAEIQTAWHNYYAGLSNKDKHEVWREFYASNQRSSHYMQARQRSAPSSQPKPTHKPQHASDPKTNKDTVVVQPYRDEPGEFLAQSYQKPKLHTQVGTKPTLKPKSVADMKQHVLRRVKPHHKLKAKQHLQSLMFGLGMGAVVLLILLFSFFNDRFIAPFITPSRQASSTPIIIDPKATAVGTNPEVIIPKINVEIPVIYDQTSIDEAAMETSLEQGVVHYATTAYPGEKGNAVVFGHSSNNIFNPGKYKFAFVLLSRLSTGDLFYLTRDGKEYVYQVYKKEIVDPTDLSVLNPTDKPATATLITCDPPGTSIHRLVVIGEQIIPSPDTNTASTASVVTSRPAILPSNAPSLWSRFVKWL